MLDQYNMKKVLITTVILGDYHNDSINVSINRKLIIEPSFSISSYILYSFIFYYILYSISRVKLVSVKDGIYHPSLPSLRKMDMDSVKSVLPDEHNRSYNNTVVPMYRRE